MWLWQPVLRCMRFVIFHTNRCLQDDPWKICFQSLCQKEHFFLPVWVIPSAPSMKLHQIPLQFLSVLRDPLLKISSIALYIAQAFFLKMTDLYCLQVVQLSLYNIVLPILYPCSAVLTLNI